MARSCNKCGFFINIPYPSVTHTDYCLFFKFGNFEIKDSEEKIKLINGKEIEIAENCEGLHTTNLLEGLYIVLIISAFSNVLHQIRS